MKLQLLQDFLLIISQFKRWDCPLKVCGCIMNFMKCCYSQHIIVIATIDYFEDLTKSFQIVRKIFY